MERVRILTGSMSDIPSDVAARLQITVVPAYVQIGTQSYRDDGTELKRKDFYTQLPNMPTLPTTAVPPAQEFTQAYRSLIGEADAVIAIVISKNLSGMYNVARLGAQEAPELRIAVVDSEQVSMGLGWTVIAAAEAAAEGQSMQQILALVEDAKSRTRVYAALDTLEFLRRSGRVSWARAKAAQILRIKPIIEVAMGQVNNVGQSRTRRLAIEQLIENTRALGPLERLAIIHTYAPELENVRQRLADLHPAKHILTVVATTIIGAHVGPRVLGVAAVTAK